MWQGEGFVNLGYCRNQVCRYRGGGAIVHISIINYFFLIFFSGAWTEWFNCSSLPAPYVQILHSASFFYLGSPILPSMMLHHQPHPLAGSDPPLHCPVPPLPLPHSGNPIPPSLMRHHQPHPLAGPDPTLPYSVPPPPPGWTLPLASTAGVLSICTTCSGLQARLVQPQHGQYL